jgi:diguanylate cyclase
MAGKLEGKNNYSILNCDVVEGVMSLLDALQTTPRGKVVYQQVEHALRDLTVSQNKIAYGYAHILNIVLETFRKHLPADSLLYLELKMVQRRLMPPISLNELAILHGYIKNVTQLTKDVIEPDEALIKEALVPLMGQAEQAVLDMASPQDISPQERPAGMQVSASETNISNDMTPSVEMHVNSVFQQRLSKHYKEIQGLQNSLSEKINTTIEQYQNFGRLLENTLYHLEKADDQVSLDEIRTGLISKIKKLISEQIDLRLILGDTQSYLSLINDNSQRLSQELDQVRVLSLTDDLTGLPNRRAFLRRAEDEIGRADRDKTTLSMVMLDLDYFKDINDRYGHAIGDEILKTYAKEVLSIFRRYDMVSRYGGEEFAVLLPNTDRTGALRALNKIKSKASSTHYLHEGEPILLPTFSCGLVIHRPGETMEKLIERADKVLYKAKQLGRNRVEVDESYLGEEVKKTDESSSKDKANDFPSLADIDATSPEKV